MALYVLLKVRNSKCGSMRSSWPCVTLVCIKHSVQFSVFDLSAFAVLPMGSLFVAVRSVFDLR